MWSSFPFFPLPIASSSSLLDLAENSCASINVHTASIGITYTTLSVTYATPQHGIRITDTINIKSRIGVGPRSYPLSFFIGFGLCFQSRFAICYTPIPLFVCLNRYAFTTLYYFPTSRFLYTPCKYYHTQQYNDTRNNGVFTRCNYCRSKKLIPRKPWQFSKIPIPEDVPFRPWYLFSPVRIVPIVSMIDILHPLF